MTLTLIRTNLNGNRPASRADPTRGCRNGRFSYSPSPQINLPGYVDIIPIMDETKPPTSRQSDGAWVPGWGKRWRPVDYLAFVVLGVLFVVVFHAATGSWFTAALLTLALMGAALALRLWRVRRVEAERD